MRIVDLDEALNDFNNAIEEEDCSQLEKKILFQATEIIEKLFETYAKPLTRCKDCKFWGTEQDGYCAAIDDPYMLETDAEDFCSWGESRVIG